MGELNQPEHLESYSERELDILRLLEEGLSNREIAQALVLSLDTIKWYNSQIYGKLGVRSRTQAVARGRELGLLGQTEDQQATETVIDPSLVAAFETLIKTAEPPPFFRPNIPIQRQSSPDRLVAREDELERLTDWLAQSNEGQGNLIFVNGEAGAGKTSLNI